MPPRCLLLALALAACHAPAGDTSGDARWDPATTVVLVTVDSLQGSVVWGQADGWDTTPFVHALAEEGVLLSNVQAARNITGPALTSLHTGTYPRDHKVREAGEVQPTLPLISERFQAAGYRTLGVSTNLCELLHFGFDEAECARDPNDQEAGWEARQDEAAQVHLAQAVRALDPDQPLFAWLHLNQVHSPYVVEQAWYDRFHPEPYEGDLDVEDVQAMNDVILGLDEATEAEWRHLRAVYASEVRAMDERVRSFVAALDEAGRWDDAVFVFGADHGEELGGHFHYVGHGCSVYQPVSGLVYVVRAPGRLPGGLALDGWVSQTDLAPTIVDLASAFAWTGFAAGRSLVDEMLAGELDEQPAFFERGVNTAGLTWGDHRIVLSGTDGYEECGPYAQHDAAFPSEPCELYDLGADPEERTNLAEDPAQASRRQDLTDRLCAWVEERPWVGTDPMMEDNLIVRTCAAR